MFCMYCGKPTEEGKTVCPECAAARSAAAAPQSTPASQKAEPFAETAFQLNTPAAKPAKPAKAAKKPAKVGVIIAAVAAVLVVAVLAVVLLAPGFFVRTFGSPESYMEHVEEKSVDEVADMVADFYGMVTGKTEQKANGISVDMHLQLGDELLSGLMMGMTGSGMDMDLSWLKDIALKINGATEGDLTKSDISIGLGKQQLLTLSVIVDMAEQAAWMGVPELNDTFLSMDLADFYENSGMDINALLDKQEELLEAMEKLPSEEVINKLISKYIGIALSHFEDVKKETKTMKVGKVKQDLTELTVKITEKDVYEIAAKILEELKDDKQAQELFAVVVEFTSMMAPSYEMVWNDAAGTYEYVEKENDIDAQELYDDFVDDGLDALEDLIDDAEKSNYIKVKTYVNNADEVVGRTISVSGEEEEISYITVWDGDKFAFEALLSSVEITGKGSREKGLIDAEYVLSSYDTEMLTLEVTDWNEKQAEEGYLCGTLRLVPGQMLLNEIMYDMPYSVASMLSGGKFALEVDLNMTEENSAAGVKLMADRTMIAGVTFSMATSEGNKVAAPTKTTEVLVNGMPDETALQEWILDMDFDAMLKNLRAAGIPSGLVDMLEMYVGQLEMYDTQYAN